MIVSELFDKAKVRYTLLMAPDAVDFVEVAELAARSAASQRSPFAEPTELHVAWVVDPLACVCQIGMGLPFSVGD